MRRLSIPVELADRLVAAYVEADLCVAQGGDAGAILDLLMAAVRPLSDTLARARRAQLEHDAMRKRVDDAMRRSPRRDPYGERIDAYPERGTL
jgi:hypothetical protein